MDAEERAITLLKDRKLKITKTRKDLISFLHLQKVAVPLSSLQKELRKTDRVTIYRTINTLLEKGVIHKALVTPNETYYALCGSSCNGNSHIHHNHVHFQCTNCTQITCETLSESLKINLPKFEIATTNILLTGICKKCNIN